MYVWGKFPVAPILILVSVERPIQSVGETHEQVIAEKLSV